MNSRQLLRAYSIKEVSQKINIPTGTIRQWEKDLNGLLVIPRTQQGARYYTDNEIKILKKMKEMREQNISRGMIRSLLEKYVNLDSESIPEPASESFEMSVQPSQEIALELTKDIQISNMDIQTNNMEEFNTTMETFKQHLLNEIKTELVLNRNDLIDEIKNEFVASSLVTVKEISKSIQRSNDKRKVEVNEISDAIMNASEHTSETFTALSKDILKDSKATYEKLSKRMDDSKKIAEKENHNVLKKVSQTIKETKDEIRNVSQSFDAQHNHLIASINELKQSQEEIQKREEVFQNMLSSFREIAAAKTKTKKWWQLWS